MRHPSFDPSAPSDAGNHLATLRALLPYLWPRGYANLKWRVVLALALLTGAKIATVYVPFLYKAAVDALDIAHGAIIVVPVAVVVAYGATRVLAQAFGELRDAVFAKVAQHAIRAVALATFKHLHRLSLRFHLERQTGGLSRAIERGTRAIQFILNFSLFNILPTLLEIFLVCGILLGLYEYWFGLITFVVISGYIAFTLVVTEWRTKYRRDMNRTDAEANTKAIDSLLNYETVKYFGNEDHEARRYDSSLARYEHAAVKSNTTLSLLNIGQGAIISSGLVAIMLLAARGVAAGTMTLGDFVLVNTFLIQLYMPLNFLGFVYREIKQSLVDMEKMFELMQVGREIDDAPGASAIEVIRGEVVLDHVSFAYDPRRPILNDVSCRVPPGRMLAIVGASGAGKSTISRILFRFYDVDSGSVRIDGRDIRSITQDSLRAAIGIVPQDTVLFNDSIGYNIRYGRPDATPEEVEEAARLAHVDTFVANLPGRLRHRGRRARAQAVGWRETARGDSSHHPQEPAHPGLRRGHVVARFANRKGHPGVAARGLGQPDDPRHRAPPVHRRRRRRDHRARRWIHRRARHPPRVAGARRPLRGDVGAPAGGGTTRGAACRGAHRAVRQVRRLTPICSAVTLTARVRRWRRRGLA